MAYPLLELSSFIETSTPYLHHELLRHIIITHDEKTFQHLEAQKLIPARRLVVDGCSVVPPTSFDLRQIPTLAIEYLTALVDAISNVCPSLDKMQLTKMGNSIILRKGCLALDDMCDNNLLLHVMKDSLSADASTSIFFNKDQNLFTLKTGNVEAFILTGCSSPSLCRAIMGIFHLQDKGLHFSTSLPVTLIDIIPWNFCHMITCTGRGQMWVLPSITNDTDVMMPMPSSNMELHATSDSCSADVTWQTLSFSHETTTCWAPNGASMVLA